MHLPALLDRNYRVLVLAASAVLLFVYSGTLFLIPVAMKQIAGDFGWPRTVPSTAFALLYIGGGLGGIVMGHWLDRAGMGKPALTAGLSIGTGLMLVSGIDSAWELFAIYFVLLGVLGHGSLFSPLMTNVIRWFDDRRGTAVGIVAAGQSLAGTVWPPVFRYLIETVGWRDAYRWFGLTAFVTMLPLSLLLMGRQPPSREADAAGDSRPRRGWTAPRPLGATIPGLATGHLQAMLSAAIVFCCAAMSMPIAHLIAHASDLGHPTARAAELLAVALAGSLASRILGLGLIANRFGGLISLFVFSSFQALSLLFLVGVHDLVGLYLIAAWFGFGYGGIVPSYPVIVREYMPPHQGGRRTATIIVFGAMGMAAGGWLGGIVFDVFHGYGPAFALGFAFNLINLALIGALIARVRRATAAAAAE